MKNDLAQIMEREDLDALWIMGAASHNPSMTYFTGTAHVGGADLILIRGKEPIIFCNAMEREEAAASGFETIVTAKYGFLKILEECQGNLAQAGAKLTKMMFEEVGLISGRVSVNGMVEIGPVLGILKYLEKMLPEIEFIGEAADSILLEARATKDVHEIERIREMGRITTGVVGKTAKYLQSCQVDDDEFLLKENGDRLTIGAMHNKINFWLAEQGVESPQGCIFAMGRDAGIPHSAGTHDDFIQLGKTIIFDIYPQEMGGGYFFDFTRTWCLGYAPEPEAALFEDVKSVYQAIMKEMKMGSPAVDFQERTCDLFEAQGHRTIRQDSQLESGYVHSLGHGLGLDVHERPWFSKRGSESDLLDAGSVVTIEPGLYYPDKGMGCRLEDTVWVRPDGKMEILADYPYDLVLTMENWKA